MIGARMPMVDAVARASGSIAYTSNAEAAGAAFGRLVRSREPHALIRAIDTSAAAAVPGVLAVLTAADLQHDAQLSPFFGPLTRDQPILALDKVRYTGEPIAAVAALDPDVVALAASLIQVDYAPLEPVLDVSAALASGAPLVHDGTPGNRVAEYRVTRGDVERGFGEADVVLECEYSTPPVQHVALEPHAVLAHVDPGGRIVVESNTQTPHHLRRQLAEIFGVPLARVRVLVSTLGGAFGSKSYTEIEPIAALLARHTRRPVKIVLERDEEFVTTARHGTRIRVQSGATRDGKLVALRATCVYDNGAYAETGERVARNAARALTAAYDIPHVDVCATACYTNSVPRGPFRAPGAAQAIWAMESHIDELAGRLHMDPLELRLRNVVRSGQSYVDGGLLEHICYPEMLLRAREALADAGNHESHNLRPGERRGRGYAIGMKTTNTPSTSTATVKMNEDGSMDVLVSSVEMGQGATTALAQIAAHRARLPLHQVRVVRPDTDSTPFDHATTSSRTTFAMGAAVEQAVDTIGEQLRGLASKQFEAALDDIELSEGRAGIVGSPDRSAGYGELITRARRGNLIGHATHVTSARPDPVSGGPGASAHYHQAVGAAEVAVDAETGRVRLLSLHGGVFVGVAINPTLCELQVEGCLAMGAGQGLFEEMVVDGGQVVNANLGDYLVPSFADVPPIIESRLYEQPESPDVHGIGEVAAPVGPPAIANAIADAVGVRIRDLPITPERVLRALRKE